MLNSKGRAKAKLSWSLFPHGNKGITPIIATILLLMMTIAIAGTAFFWVSRIQNQMQGGVESYQSTLLMQMSSRVDVREGTNYNTTTENLTIILQNTGNTRIPIRDCCEWPKTDWTLRDSNQVSICASDWSLLVCEGCAHGGNITYIEVGDIHKVVLNLNSTDCDISSYSGGQVFSFTIDFSGVATASGTFIKPS